MEDFKSFGWKIRKGYVMLFAHEGQRATEAVIETAQEIGVAYDCSLYDVGPFTCAVFYLDAQGQERKLQIDEIIKRFHEKIE